MSKYIVFSAGHGGTDPGAVGNGYKEHTLALELWNLVADYIRDNYKDVVVKVVEEKDSNGNFKSFSSYWGNYKSGGAYSGHFNSYTSSSAHGTEVLVGNFGTKRCNAVNKALAKHFSNRGLKEVNTNDYYMLREVGFDMIMETCFISSKSDMDYYQKNKKTIAIDLAKAIASVEGLTKKSGGSTVNKPNKYTRAIKDESHYDKPEKDRQLYLYEKMVCDVPVYRVDTNKQSGTIPKGKSQRAWYAGTRNGRHTAKFKSNNYEHYFYTEKK